MGLADICRGCLIYKGPGPGLGVLELEPVVKVWVGIRLGEQGRGRDRDVCSDLFISLLIIRVILILILSYESY